ncbi:MAG: hypothetical protein K8L99_31750 [Anaerolineae bacterium]|nr:hypothetical protein [Anaerolineae bacterium]
MTRRIKIIKGCLLLYIGLMIFLILFLGFPSFTAAVFYGVMGLLGADLTDTSPHFYSPAAVQEICTALQFDAEDEFCISNRAQNYETLSATLETYYPVSKTTYHTLQPIISVLPTSHTCKSAENYLRAQIDNCPLPTQCTENYSCYIEFSDAVGYLHFRIQQRTGRITLWSPIRPSELE